MLLGSHTLCVVFLEKTPVGVHMAGVFGSKPNPILVQQLHNNTFTEFMTVKAPGLAS